MEQHQFEALLEQRAQRHQRMTEINDAAEAEEREFTAEEQTEWDRLEGEFDTLSERIKREEQLRRNDPTLTAGHPSPGDGRDDDPAERSRREVIASEEYRDAFGAYLRGGLEGLSAEERTTLNVGTDADGGYTVPEEWTELYEPLQEAGTIRGLAEVITTESGNPLHIPKVTADASAVEIEGEEDAIADDAETFGEAILQAFKYAQIVKAADEFVQDTMIDLGAFVGRRAGFRIGRAQNADFVKGVGSTTEPAGLFAGATVGETAAGTTVITLDEVIDLTYSVIGPYRRGAVYIANDSTHAALRKIKDENGQYLWQPSVQAGEPDMLNGYPIYADPDVDAIAADKRPLGFGNVRLAYTIRDAGGVAVKFLVERYADTGQVAWRVQQRSDGDLIDANAFKVLETPESS